MYSRSHSVSHSVFPLSLCFSLCIPALYSRSHSLLMKIRTRSVLPLSLCFSVCIPALILILILPLYSRSHSVSRSVFPLSFSPDEDQDSLCTSALILFLTLYFRSHSVLMKIRTRSVLPLSVCFSVCIPALVLILPLYSHSSHPFTNKPKKFIFFITCNAHFFSVSHFNIATIGAVVFLHTVYVNKK